MSARAVMRSAALPITRLGALPQTLILFVTSRCNARCDFCLYWDQINDPTAAREELTPEEIDRVAAQYGRLHYLALSGGEPFVRDDLAPICQSFIDRCGTSVVDIPSNFWFGDRMAATLETLTGRNPGVVFDLQLSLDHVGPRHDESRQVKGLYERARASFEALADLRAERPHLKLKINVVYLERNAGDLEEIGRRVRDEFDCDRIQLTYPNELVPVEGSEEHAAQAASFRRAAPRLNEAVAPRGGLDLHTLGLRASKRIYGELIQKAADGTRPMGEYCNAGRDIVVVTERGEVFPCEPLWTPIGDLRSAGYDLRRILRDEPYRRFREQHLGPGACNCTWGCAALSHVSVSSRFLPGLGLEAARLAVGDRRRSGAGE